MSDKENKETKTKARHCPFLNKCCIKERCTLWAEMQRNMGDLQQKFGMCSLAGLIIILAEINTKTQSFQQKIQVPNLIRR